MEEPVTSTSGPVTGGALALLSIHPPPRAGRPGPVERVPRGVRTLARRASTRDQFTCSSRCRSALARIRRRDDLLSRVRRAETALKEAADALALLRELAGLDATLELRSLLIGGGP